MKLAGVLEAIYFSMQGDYNKKRLKVPTGRVRKNTCQILAACHQKIKEKK